MLCFMPGVAFVPALLVCWSSAAFIISYVIAVLGGHVEPLLPYISDTGTKPPESGVFGFMINISAFLGATTMYIRYLILEKQNESSNFTSPSCNLITLCIGLLGCFGMGIVANFQELAVPSVHDGGALVAFVSGVVYITLQSIISFKSCPQWNSHSTCYIRMGIAVVSCIAVIPMIVCASLISIKIDWIPGEKQEADRSKLSRWLPLLLTETGIPTAEGGILLVRFSGSLLDSLNRTPEDRSWQDRSSSE